MGEAYIVRRGGGGVSSQRLYEYGVFNQKVGHASVKTPTGSKVEYASSYIAMSTVANAVSEVYECFGPVNLSRYSRVIAELEHPGDLNIYGCVFVAESPNAARSDAVAVINQVMEPGSSIVLPLDVSGINLQNCYVYAGFNTNGGSWANARSDLRLKTVTLGV